MSNREKHNEECEQGGEPLSVRSAGSGAEAEAGGKRTCDPEIESVGIADILHSLGNILGTVIMNAELGILETAQESEGRRCFESILQAGRKARDLVDHCGTSRRWKRTRMEPREMQSKCVVGARVLLVDDEESLRTLWGRMIESLGCSVMRAENAESALKCFRSDPARVDLVITDMNMPGISGLELSELIHRERPELPIMLSTGFENECEPEELQAAGVRVILKKPLERGELAMEIEKVFSSRRLRSS